MLVVRVELWSAITGQKTELARMVVANSGDGTASIGNYDVTVYRGRSAEALDRKMTQHSGRVIGHSRLPLHVWHLVAKALAAVGYGDATQPTIIERDSIGEMLSAVAEQASVDI